MSYTARRTAPAANPAERQNGVPARPPFGLVGKEEKTLTEGEAPLSGVLHLQGLFGVVRAVGVEPTRIAPQEPKSCASANSAIPAQERRGLPRRCFLTRSMWQNSRPASPPGAAAPPSRPPSAAAPPNAACRCSCSPWRSRGPRRRGWPEYHPN